MDSLDPFFNDHLILEGAPNEAIQPLEEGIPAREPSNVHEIGEGAPSGVATALILSPKPTDTESSRKMSSD